MRTTTTYNQVTITRSSDEVFGEMVEVRDLRFASEDNQYKGRYVLFFDQLLEFIINEIKATKNDLGNDEKLVELANTLYEKKERIRLYEEEIFEPTEADCWDGDGTQIG